VAGVVQRSPVTPVVNLLAAEDKRFNFSAAFRGGGCLGTKEQPQIRHYRHSVLSCHDHLTSIHALEIHLASFLQAQHLAQVVQGTEPHGLRLRQLIQKHLVLSGLLESPKQLRYCSESWLTEIETTCAGVDSVDSSSKELKKRNQ
jgi:hypothetical protein